MEYNKLLMFILGIFLISSVSALTCSVTSINRNITVGETLTSQLVTCHNEENFSVTVSKFGSFYSTSPSTLTISNNSDLSFTVDFTQMNSEGTSNGYLFYGSLNIPISINAKKPTGLCEIDIFPLSLSGVKLSQGDKKSRNIQLSVPSCYKTNVKINGVTLSTDEKPIQLAEISLGTLKPGNSIQIPLDIDTTGIATGSYSDILSFLMYDEEGKKIDVPSVNIAVMVTAGITPVSNFSFDMLPTCSFSATTINLNASYTLTCTINNPNILPRPNFNQSIIKGLSATLSSTQYIYYFTGIKSGTTTFCTEFVYVSSSIGTPYCQEIKVTPSGQTLSSGIFLKPEFYQNGIKKDLSTLGLGETVLLIVDNSSNNLVTPDKIIINSATSNNTFTMDSLKTYEIRIQASGYNDLLISNLTTNIVPINFDISPIKNLYKVGDTLFFNSSIPNVSYLVNDFPVGNPYTLGYAGNLTIKSVKEGYISTNKSIQVDSVPAITSCTPIQEDWKKGSKIICQLSKVGVWSVSINNTQIANGNSDKIEFTISQSGNLVILADSSNIYSKNIVSSGVFDFIKKYWIIILAIIVVLVFLYFMFLRKSNTDSTSSSAKYEFG